MELVTGIEPAQASLQGKCPANTGDTSPRVVPIVVRPSTKLVSHTDSLLTIPESGFIIQISRGSSPGFQPTWGPDSPTVLARPTRTVDVKPTTTRRRTVHARWMGSTDLPSQDHRPASP